MIYSEGCRVELHKIQNQLHIIKKILEKEMKAKIVKGQEESKKLIQEMMVQIS